MVAWIVMNRQQPRQTPPSFFPAPIPILGLTPPSSQEKLLLCFHTLAWNPFYNPFVFKFMHVMGGCPPSSGSRLPVPYPLSPACPQQSRGIPFLFTFLRTLLHFFALAQISTVFFSSDSALFAKNTRGGGPSAVFAIAGEPRA